MGRIAALILSLAAMGIVTLSMAWLSLLLARAVRTQYRKFTQPSSQEAPK